MRTSAMILLLAILALGRPVPRPRRTAQAEQPAAIGAGGTRPVSRSLPSGVRDQEGDEDLLVRRVPGNLPSDAGVPPRMLRVPAAAPLRTSKMCEEAGQEGVPGRGSRLQVRRACTSAPSAATADRQNLPPPRPTLHRRLGPLRRLRKLHCHPRLPRSKASIRPELIL